MVISSEYPTPATHSFGSLNLCKEAIRVKQISVGLEPIIFDEAAAAVGTVSDMLTGGRVTVCGNLIFAGADPVDNLS